MTATIRPEHLDRAAQIAAERGVENRPFTPETLAMRWGCSAETVRDMVRSGRLPAFRVGRMMRIAAQTVEDFECGTIELAASTGASSSCGTMAPPAAVIALRQTRPKRQNRKPAT